MGRIESLAALVGIDDAARTLGVSVYTLRRWIAQQRVPFVRLGRCVRFDPHALAQFIETNSVEAREEGR